MEENKTKHQQQFIGEKRNGEGFRKVSAAKIPASRK